MTSPPPDESAAVRLAELLEAVRERTGGRRGWQREIAEILGLNPSHVSRVLRGYGPEVSWRVIESICDRTGIDYRYFDQNPRGRPFTEFLVPVDIIARWVDSEALDVAGGIASRLTLRTWRSGPGAPTESEFRQMAEALLRMEPFDTALAVREGRMPFSEEAALELASKVILLEESVQAYGGGGHDARQARRKFREMIGLGGHVGDDETESR